MYQGLWLSSGIFGSNALDLVRDIGQRNIELDVVGNILNFDVEYLMSVALTFKGVLLKPSLRTQV